MKYFALLFDSFRQAIDNKVIYVTISLTLVLFLGLATTKFQPVESLEEEVEYVLGMLNWSFSFPSPEDPGKHYLELESLKQTNDAEKPWEGEYFFLMTLNSGEEDSEVSLKKSVVVESSMYGHFNNMFREVQVLSRQQSSDSIQFRVRLQEPKINAREQWIHYPAPIFGLWKWTIFRGPLNQMVYVIQNVLVNNVGGWVIVFIGVLVTSFFIPNMLQKGTVDLMISKPVSRVWLLIFKYVGGLTFVFINCLIAIIGTWLILGMRTGIWCHSFLLAPFVITYFFAILYSVATLFGVLSRNSIISLFMTLLIWLVLFVIGTAHYNLHQSSNSKNPEPVLSKEWQWLGTTVDTLHFILPRTDDLESMVSIPMRNELFTERQMNEARIDTDKENSIIWFESIAVSLVFIAVMLGLSCWYFSTRDF